MILSVQRFVHDAIAEAVRRHFGIADVPAFAVEVPPNRALGDLAVTVAFQLARTLRKPPRAIAQELVNALGSLPGIARVTAAPNGYLNLFLDRPAFLLDRVVPDRASRLSMTVEPGERQKTIVEHTAINPNKAAHVGHLRNAALGDTLVRVLKFRATPVETQNYIDDTGVQVADVVVGFREIEHLSLDQIRHVADTTRFDYYCWDLYSRVTEWYEEDKARLDVRQKTLHDLELGGNDAAVIGAFIVDRIVRAHLKTMTRLNIGYDLLTYEGDILRLQFWAHAFEILKEQGAVFLQTEGKLKGCWVMRIEEAGAGSEDDGDAESREKVIVRSNGVVTYVGKDIANQFWKFGLLGRDFRYHRFAEQRGGRTLWATTSARATDAPPLAAGRIYNVMTPARCICRRCSGSAAHAGHPQAPQLGAFLLRDGRAVARHCASAPGARHGKYVKVSGRKAWRKIDDLLTSDGQATGKSPNGIPPSRRVA